jgi:polyisoprenoid-binding protein YceI
MKIKTIVLALSVIFFAQFAIAQKYITKNGHISFFSSTPMENIEAHNNQVNSALDSETGDFVFKILMKSFEFEKALMQEHFNENYVNSDKYPNATFKGKIVNIEGIDFNTPGTYEVQVEGVLTIKGESREVSEKGTFTITAEGVNGKSEFNIAMDDYGIKIPKAVKDNIANVIKISVDVKLKELKK